MKSTFSYTFYQNTGVIFIFLTCLFSCKSVVVPYQHAGNQTSNNLYRDISSTDTTTIANIPWQKMFSDTLLQALIQEGINNNLDLKVAVARIHRAAANFEQSKLASLPSLAANAGITYQKIQHEGIGTPEIYTFSLSSSWEADIWGKFRSAKRSALALFLQSEAYRRAVQTQLVADIAINYFALMAFDAQLQITQKTVANRIEEVETIKRLKDSDVVTGAAVVQSAANRYSVEVTIPDLKQNIRETENAICYLLGRESGPISRNLLDSQMVMTDLRTGIPLQLLANRPDIQEAEFQVRANFELINVAKTYFYPTLNITAQGGWSTSQVSDLFSASSILGNIFAGLTQPIFNKGLNIQRLKVAQANEEESLATFRQTILGAGQEVSNALYDFQAASDKITLRSQQIVNLQKAVEYTKELLKYTSNTNYTDVLTSEQSLLAAQLNSIRDKLQQLQAIVTLYRSLGGGWK